MDQQAPLNLSFVRVFGHGQKIEVVRVFQNLLGQIGAGRGKRALEIGQRLPFPLMQPTGNLEDENIPAPAVFERGAEIPFTCGTVLDPVEQRAYCGPRAILQQAVAQSPARARPRPKTAYTEDSRAEALDAGKLVLQIVGQPLDNLGAPASGARILAREDLSADRPVEEDQFPAHGKGGANLGGADAGFQLLKEFGVTGGCLKSVCHLATQFIRRGHSLQ